MILLRQRIARDSPEFHAGTPGSLILADWRTYRTIELPWLDNEPNLSCIPAGGPYPLRRRRAEESERFSYDHIAIGDVPDRDAILMHGMNFAGTKAKGFKCEALGCVGPGLSSASRKARNGIIQPGVASSRIALRRILKAVVGGDDQLWIAWADDTSAASPSGALV